MGEASDVSVVLVDATMLGDLGGAVGIYYAFDWAHDDVWYGWVFSGVAKAQGDQSRTVDDVLDPEVKTGRIETCHSFIGIGAVFKEDKCNVVGCSKRNIDTSSSRDKIWADLGVFSRVDRSLSVLRGNDD